MKKTTKILAVILAMITLMSFFSIMSGAINSKSSAKELLDYYEDCIIKTSAKEDIIKSRNFYKDQYTPDFSSLKGEDLEDTKVYFEEESPYNTFWYEMEYDAYFYGDAYGKDYDGRSEFIDYFSIKRDIRNFNLKFKKSEYSKEKNGDVNIVFTYIYPDYYTDEESHDAVLTYNIVISKDGYLKSYSEKTVTEFYEYSVNGNSYKITWKMLDIYKFSYKKVAVKDIKLSEEKIVLKKDEYMDVTPIIKPSDATFKDVYIYIDYEVADYYIYSDGTIEVSAMGPGETVMEVYTYDGDLCATCEVVVEYTFFERIGYFFETLFEDIRLFFEELSYGSEEY